MMRGRELLARLRGALGRGRRDEELQEELAFHLAMLEEQHRRRGLSPAEARRAARLEMGGSTEAAVESWRDQRGLPWLEELWRDLRGGARSLRRSRGFTTAALLTLAIGIGANTAIFSVVDAVLLRPLPYASADRLVTVGDRNDDGSPTSLGFVTTTEWKARSRTLADLALMRFWLPSLVADGEAERVPAVRVSWNYFDMLGVHPALGRGFERDDDRPDAPGVLLLGDGLWRRRFGADPRVVGRLVRLNDRDYRVVGVLPASFEPLLSARYFGQPAQAWAPLAYDASLRQACRSCQHLRAFARLRDGVTPAQAAAELTTIRQQQRREHPDDYDTSPAAVQPLHEGIAGPVAKPLRVLFFAVALVLLIACANVANLLLARALDRQRELALRAALGAGRRRIVRQLLTESALLGVLGALGGALLAAVGVRALAAAAPSTLPRPSAIGIDARVLAFAMLLGLLAAIVFGLAPAVRAASMGLRATIATGGRGHVGGHGRARAALVVLDMALALALLASAGVMLRTVDGLLATDPGFDPRGVHTVQLSLVGERFAEDAQVLAFQERLLARVRAIPGVRAAALAGQVPLGGNQDMWGFHVAGLMQPNPADDPSAERYAVTPGYFRLLGIPLLAGRFVQPSDGTGAEPVIVVSATTAKQVWGARSPLGARVRVGDAESGPWRTVVGVVGDVRHADLTAPPAPAMYMPQAQNTDSFLVLVVKAAGADPQQLQPAIRAAVRELDPTVPLDQPAAMDELLARAVADRRFVTRVLACFAVTALLLAAIGLYGVVAYGVAQRRAEVAVRVALGAGRGDIVRTVAGDGLVTVALGLAAGAAAALVATRFLGGLAFGVSVRDPTTFGAAAALLLLVAAVAHWVPVRRALRTSPVAALRAE